MGNQIRPWKVAVRVVAALTDSVTSCDTRGIHVINRRTWVWPDDGLAGLITISSSAACRSAIQ